MFMKFEKEIEDLLSCSFCNGSLNKNKNRFVCKICGLQYPKKNISIGKSNEMVFDFRIHHPIFCIPEVMQQWEFMQKEYEDYHITNSELDDLKTYLDEIDSVKEVYTKEFKIKGKVLDIGGHQ